jgi:hypothetical protein
MYPYGIPWHNLQLLVSIPNLIFHVSTTPLDDCYGKLVDVLGRAGWLGLL